MNIFSKTLIYKKSNLPSEYQEVEYIKGNGAQYINTLYKPNTNTELWIDFKDDVTNEWENYFGCDNNFRFQRYYTSNDQMCWICSNNNVQGTIDLTKRLKLKFNKSGVYNEEGNQLIANTNLSISTNYNLLIFEGYYQGNLDQYGNYYLYNMKIYESDTLVKNYVPCYRKSDNEIGLYEAVSGEFKTNKGSGSFTKGPNI